MKISFVSPLLSRHLNPMGARTQTASREKEVLLLEFWMLK